jgi:hypothetical protein
MSQDNFIFTWELGISILISIATLGLTSLLPLFGADSDTLPSLEQWEAWAVALISGGAKAAISAVLTVLTKGAFQASKA